MLNKKHGHFDEVNTYFNSTTKHGKEQTRTKRKRQDLKFQFQSLV